MSYQAFANDSLTMMYEGVRCPWLPMTRSAVWERNLDFVFARRPTGNCTLLISKPKCSGAE
jgi:hypothetical protein